MWIINPNVIVKSQHAESIICWCEFPSAKKKRISWGFRHFDNCTFPCSTAECDNLYSCPRGIFIRCIRITFGVYLPETPFLCLLQKSFSGWPELSHASGHFITDIQTLFLNYKLFLPNIFLSPVFTWNNFSFVGVNIIWKIRIRLQWQILSINNEALWNYIFIRTSA